MDAIGDPSLYEGEGSAERVAELSQEKVQLERAMVEAEAAWLDAQEALEAANTP